MTNERNEAGEARTADARLVERIARAWAPSPLDEAGRARFDARLRERIEARGAPRLARGWLASLAGAGALAGLALFAVARGSLAPVEPPVLVETAALSAWEWDLLLGSGLEGGQVADDEGLPADYAAIASVFLAP